MSVFHRCSIVPCLVFIIGAFCSAPAATEYFVSLDGCDESHDGRSRASAFATIQKGVDALNPGDTLTILPGEYFESVYRAGLGSNDAVTTIRADIPGTAVLRGDVFVHGFRKLDDHGFVWVAEVDDCYDKALVVNELNTLTILQSRPNVAEVEFTPGTFHHDLDAGRLYISTSDGRPAGMYLYSVSVIERSGIHLAHPQRVVIEGIGATGFNTSGINDAGRGVYLTDAWKCVVRDCNAWMNGWGVEVTSTAQESGGNTIERCVAWANDSPFANWRRGGLTMHRHRGDVIRDSTAFLNSFAGAYLRSDSDPEKTSRLLNNLAWGNRWDFIIKGNADHVNVMEGCVSGSQYSPRKAAIQSLFLPRRGRPRGEGEALDSIALGEEEDLDVQREFADPDNHDYRLQSTSRFRGSAPDGGDRGPYPYAANVFFVQPEGDDGTDGLSMESAWRTVSRGLRDLRPGDTLYIAPGIYRENIEMQLRGAAEKPVLVRGRGVEPVVIEGVFRIRQSADVGFKRLWFAGPVAVGASDGIGFDQCFFAAADTSLAAEGVDGLRVMHCAFNDFRQAAVSMRDVQGAQLSGNLFENRGAVAVRVDTLAAVRYSDYNAYRDPGLAWCAGGRSMALTDFGNGHERYSLTIPENHEVKPGLALLHHRPPFAARGPMGMPFGPYRAESRIAKLRLTGEPAVHSLSATTADIEWKALLPSRVHLVWGATPEMENSDAFDADFFGSYSLTGLAPGTTYYFQIKALEESQRSLSGHATGLAAIIQARATEIESDVLTFTTLDRDSGPVTYYVAPEGDNANSGLSREDAWRTVQHAANRVNVGDTVLLSGGKYEEQTRIRTTGAEHAPVTFRSLPGAKVVFSGPHISDAFDISGKGHLRFDGMYFLSMRFNLYRVDDIRITRIFAGSYDSQYPPTGVLLHGIDSRGIHIKNCVVLGGKSGPRFQSCADVRVENSVFFRNMIFQILFYPHATDAPVHLVNNIFTDNLPKKRSVPMIGVIRRPDTLVARNNCFYPRAPWNEKAIIQFRWHADFNFEAMENEFGPTGSLLADPGFAGLADVPAQTDDGRVIYPPDRMCRPGLITLDKFFATNPDLAERGIGLQPEAFADFHFHRDD